MTRSDRCCCGIFDSLTAVRVLATLGIAYNFLYCFVLEKFLMIDDSFFYVLVHLLFSVPWVLVFVAVAKGRSQFMKPAMAMQAIYTFVYGALLLGSVITALFPHSLPAEQFKYYLQDIVKIVLNVEVKQMKKWDEVVFYVALYLIVAYAAMEALTVWTYCILRNAYYTLKAKKM